MSKNSSTAPTITTFISKNSQATLIHDLPYQLCRKWSVFAVKGTYAGIEMTTFFKGFSSSRVKKNLASASAVAGKNTNSGLEIYEMS